MTEENKATEFKLRVTADLRRQIEHAARANGRTMNAEIVARLMWAFEHDGSVADVAAKVLRVTGGSDVMEKRIASLETELSELKSAFTTHIDWHLANDKV